MEKAREFSFSQKEFRKLRQMALEYTGIQGSDDKYEMYYSRLTKRLRALNLNSFASYVALVERDQQEFLKFINSITTNVTAFGREQHHFDYLADHIKKERPRTFHIWSAGCSSGEEPYSIIINIAEACKAAGTQLKITATDLDTEVLGKASDAIYNLRAVERYDLPTKRKFFMKGVGSNQGSCRVKPEYRSLVDYQQLNLIKEWRMPDKYDAIFCRNVMIYFDNEIKKRITEKYADHLQSRGLLFLGHSESLHQINDRFENVGKTIYRKSS